MNPKSWREEIALSFFYPFTIAIMIYFPPWVLLDRPSVLVSIWVERMAADELSLRDMNDLEEAAVRFNVRLHSATPTQAHTDSQQLILIKAISVNYLWRQLCEAVPQFWKIQG